MNKQYTMMVAAAGVGVFFASLYRSGGEILSSLLAAVVTGAVTYGMLWAWSRRKS